jgi:Flp pilus assembly protein TadB
LETEAKVGIAIAIVLVLTAFVDLKISATIATAYLIAYAVNRMRKDRKRREATR